MEIGTITRRMDSALEELDKDFGSFYTRNDFNRKLAGLEFAGNKSSRPSILASLFRMFDSCGIAYEKGRDNAYYKRLVAKSDFLSFSEMEDKMLYSLYEIYEKYPTPEQYMLRIVNRLSTDNWDTDSLRLRILKQFIKYGNYLSDAKYGGRNYIQRTVKEKIGRKPNDDEILDHLSDTIFEGLKEATKPQKKPEGKFGLLKLADDLAEGKFRTGGATKKGLYLFAMVYGMTYYTGAADEIIDYQTDIEKNLFQDYYTNNLMRFITEAYSGKLCEYELDPSGQGINYKNFAEIIYLYFLVADESPRMKVKLASEMIERVQQRGKDPKEALKLDKGKGTMYFKNMVLGKLSNPDFYTDDLFHKPKDEFEDFLVAHYDCRTVIPFSGIEKERNVGVMQVESEQKTAYQVYHGLIEQLKGKVQLEQCNYGLWFTDIAAFKKKGISNICNRMPGIDRKKFEQFMDLLLGVNSFLGNTVCEEDSRQNGEQEHTAVSTMKTKALYVPDANAVTRTSLIVAYYYYYNGLQEEGENSKSFGELFRDFKQGIDPLLEEAFYQPLSGKNIFDLLVVFSSYAYFIL